MDFDYSPRQKELMRRVSDFMDEHIYPAVPIYEEQQAEGERWKVIPIVEELKAKARKTGLWNMFMPPHAGMPHVDDTFQFEGVQLTNLEYAPICEMFGRVELRLRGVQLLGAGHRQHGGAQPLRHARAEGALAAAADERRDPLGLPDDRAAGRLLRRHQHRDPHRARRRPLCDQRPQVVVVGRRRSALQGRHRHGQDQPRRRAAPAAVADPGAARHAGREGRCACCRCSATTTRRTATPRCCWRTCACRSENLLLGEGRGFEIAQARLGPGRIHHCMRTIGAAEVALEKMCKRLMSRKAFGKYVSEHSVWEQRVAAARTDIEMNRLLCLKAADMMDKAGNKTARLEISMIKVAAPNMALRIIDDAIQAHGGGGVTSDFGLAKIYASQRTLRLADGPDEVHNRTIARMEFAKYGDLHARIRAERDAERVPVGTR